MPKPLVAELRGLVHKNHYLDLSEELRSVIRQRARYYLDPHVELKEQLEHNIKTQNQALKKAEILRELKKLLEVDE